MARARLLLADDHSLVVAGLKKLLEPEFDVIGTVEDGRALVTCAQKMRPDVVLLDISMPLLNGIEAARQIHRSHPNMKIIFVTMHADPDYVSAAFDAGALGFVVKRSAASELARAIRQVLRGGTYVTPLVQEPRLSLRAGRMRGLRSLLTPRQREVLQLVAEGKPAKDIARILGVSVKTVEFHKTAITQRLGLQTIAELTRYAIERGIAPIDH
jgi:DNA-binding NarL/FixJ family response regulator